MKKRIPALLLSLVMCLSLLPAGVFAAAEQDMPSDWSKEAMEAAVENGLLQGDDLGNLNPKDLLTRAQMAAVITRAFGAAKQADLSAYADMDSGKWYYEAVSKAAHMGIMGGDGRYMSPDRDITRQEAFTVLARAMRLPAGDPAALKSFHDADAVADWAAGSMAAMVAAGYVGGSNGMLNPMGRITREEFAQVMFNIFGTYCTQAGTYTEAPARSVMVNVPDVTLKNVKVHGDIIVGDGVGEGDVTLDHVTLEGRLVVRGGGVNSVHIIGGEQAWQVIIAKVDGNVRVVADEGTKVETVTVEDGSDDIIIEGSVATVNVETEGITVKLNNAKVDKLNVVAANTAVTMTGKTEVNYLSVSEGAEGTKVEAEKTVTISNVLADTDLTLTGEAKVEKIEGSGAVTDESGEAVKETPEQTPVYVPPYTPPAHTHTWVDGAILTPATCAAEGSMEQTCSGCGATQTAVIPKLPHTEEEIPAVAATCSAGGLTAGKRCTVCQTVTQAQEPVDALGHDWGEGEVTTPATCTTAGAKTFTCSRCQAAKTEPIPMTEHDWDMENGEESSNDDCGTITTYRCKTDGCIATKVVAGEDVQHTAGDAVQENEIPATCAAGGSYDEVVYCSKCHAELSREHKTTEKADDHTVVTDAAVEPTCTGTGKTEGKHCSVCGEVIAAQTILPATGHTFAEEWSSDGDNHWHAATCEHTGETKDKAAHNWNAGEVTTEPTCETAGVKTFTCTVCAATKDEPIEKLGHDWEGISKVEATCTEAGREAGKRCKREGCNATEGLAEIPALRHDWEEIAKVEPTCAEAGHEAGKRCKREGCGATEGLEIISATGIHTPGEWEVTKEATATEAGTRIKKCTVCQTVVESETIPATGSELPTLPEPTGFSFCKYFDGSVAVTADFADDFVIPEGLTSYNIKFYLSNDGGNTWTKSLAQLSPGRNNNMICFNVCTLDEGVTYSKMKLDSSARFNGTLIERSEIFDCNITVTANSNNQNVSATFSVENNTCSYSIAGFNANSDVYHIIFSTAERFDEWFYIPGGAITAEGPTENSVTDSNFAGTVYYSIVDYTYNDQVISGTTASFTFNRTAWTEVTVTENAVLPAVTAYQFSCGSTLGLSFTPPTDTSNIGSYSVYLQKENDSEWTEAESGTSSTELICFGDTLPAGHYTKIKITSNGDLKSNFTPGTFEAACDLTVTQNTAAALNVTFAASTRENDSKEGCTCTVDGLTEGYTSYIVYLSDNADGEYPDQTFGGTEPSSSLYYDSIKGDVQNGYYQVRSYKVAESAGAFTLEVTVYGNGWTKCNFAN